MTAPMAMIATIIAIDIDIKYRPAIDTPAVGCGVAVAATGSTANEVMACDGQYDSEPANEAYTVYCPSMSGFQFKL